LTGFKDFLKEEFKKDKGLEKEFYQELEKTRIAIEIAAFRTKAGLSQTELARRVGTSQSSIARMENADYQNYSMRMLRKIAEVLDLELVVSLREKESSARKPDESRKVVSIMDYRARSRYGKGYSFPDTSPFTPLKKTIGG
jgi:transcriptional regulator with XRE-family HTH domain